MYMITYTYFIFLDIIPLIAKLSSGVISASQGCDGDGGGGLRRELLLGCYSWCRAFIHPGWIFRSGGITA